MCILYCIMNLQEGDTVNFIFNLISPRKKPH